MKHVLTLIIFGLFWSTLQAQPSIWKQVPGPNVGTVIQVEAALDGGIYAFTNDNHCFYWDSSAHHWDLLKLPVSFIVNGSNYGHILAERSGALLFYNTYINTATSTAQRGIYRSSDRGKSWTLAYQHTTSHPYFASIAQSATGRLYAFKGGIGESQWDTTEIYRSEDQGASWQKLSMIKLPSVSFAVDGSDNCYFSVAGSHPSIIHYDAKQDFYTPWVAGNNIPPQYCQIAYYNGSIYARGDSNFYRIRSNGDWEQVSSLPSLSYYGTPAFFTSSNGRFVTSTIDFSPYYHTVYLASDDLGKTWNTMPGPDNVGPAYICFDSSGTDYLCGTGPYIDNNITGAGLYRSADHTHWKEFGVPNMIIARLREGPQGLLNAEEVSSLIYNSFYYEALQFASRDSGRSWVPTATLFPSLGTINDTVYTLRGNFCKDGNEGFYYFGQVELFSPSSSTYRNFTSFASMQQPLDFQIQTTFLYQDGLPVTFSGDHAFYAILGGGLSKTTDHGISWDVIQTPTTSTGLYTAAIDGAATLYTGFAPGLYRSSNQGSSWEKLQTGLRNAAITNIRFIGTNTIILGTLGDGIWRSIDHGATWQQWGSAGDTISAIEVSGSRCYAATKHGLLSCDINSTNWIRELPTNYDNAALTILKMDDGRLYTSLDHNGIWTNDPSFKATLVQHIDRYSSETSLSARWKGNELAITYINPESAQTKIALYDLLGRQIEVIADEFISAGETTITKQLPSISKGTYILTVKGAGSPLIQKILR